MPEMVSGEVNVFAGVEHVEMHYEALERIRCEEARDG
jgi:hypothetical protein